MATATADLIEDDEWLDIELEVRRITEKGEDHPVEYFADCHDRAGNLVKLTVFSDNLPEVDLEEGEWYSFSDVRGEHWEEDGTPGIKFRPNSDVRPVDGPTGEAGPPGSENEGGPDRGPIIDRIDVEREPRRRPLPDRLPRWGRFAISAVLTTAAVAASLFAPVLDTTGRVAVLVAVTSVILGGVYVNQYQPSERIRQRRQREHVELLLEFLQEDYRRVVDAPPPIRLNVMRVEGLRLLGTPTLRMFAHVGEYTPNEQDLEFEPGQGAAGEALQTGDVEVYDERERHQTEKDLTAKQREITGGVESAVSVPIASSSSSRVVGVLNVDSEGSLAETRFDDEDVQRLAEEYARLVRDVIE